MHDMRLDGMRDILHRAQGRSVMDIGCNRGAVAWDFAHFGAVRVCGVDNYAKGIETAREIFADMRSVSSQFEVIDLTKGRAPLVQAFGPAGFDLMVILATVHKLRRAMDPDKLDDLLGFLGSWTRQHFVWRGTSYQHDENNEEIQILDRVLKPHGLIRTHTSYLSTELGACAIWSRV